MSNRQKTGKAGGGGPKGRRRGVLRMSAGPWLALAAVLILSAAFIVLRLPSPAAAAQITAKEAYEKYQAGAFFLDVRTQAEYDAAHIARSVLIPLDDLETRLSEVPRDRDVVVICRSGTRSKEGAAILRQAGYKRVSCLTGGLMSWNQAGYPLDGGQ